MRWLARKRDLIYPKRASTQTWMFLTLSLFMGTSVVFVGLYVIIIHGSQVQNAAQEQYLSRTTQIANIIGAAESDSARIQAASEISDANQVHIMLVRGDSMLWHQEPPAFESAERPEVWPTVWPRPVEGGHSFVSRETASGDTRVAVAFDLPDADLIVGVEHSESPLHAVAERMAWTLMLGILMALLMAMVTSWVAAYKVTTPLLAIGQSAKDIIAGKLDTPIRVETRSAEIQDLALHLDRMTISYREKIQELERLTRLQGEFLGNVSHEVRNPVFAISGYLEALGSPKLDAAKRERFAANGLMNLQRLGNLFESLIEIARLEYREDWIQTADFDVTDLLHEVADMLRPKADAKGLTLQTSGPVLFVRADRDKIRRVFVNLIDNAIVYSDRGTVRCHIEHRDDKVRFEIADNGRGISAENQSRIFERFFRVEPHRSRKSGGAGLGLSIVKQILQAHKEPIHIESAVGEGTRFWFELTHVASGEAIG